LAQAQDWQWSDDDEEMVVRGGIACASFHESMEHRRPRTCWLCGSGVQMAAENIICGSGQHMFYHCQRHKKVRATPFYWYYFLCSHH
jgi:hypothetical protein